jgi:hypothetical protein
MIQPQELRIGNYVESRGTYVQVIRIDWDSDLQHCTPIPITPDILERLGFSVDDMNYNSDKENYCMCVYEDTYLHINSKIGATRIGSYEHSADVEFGTVSTTFYIQDIKYLHQLQNLIFALSGIELTFKTN